jgi:glycosyltransferase involved in cell wall biosynthesis
MEKVLIAIPCFNCHAQIQRTLLDLEKSMANVAIKFNVLLLDNGSEDGTVEAAMAIATNLPIGELVIIAKNEMNYGLGGSQKIAFRFASNLGFSHLAVLHGDHQADPFDLPRLLDVSVKNGGASVLGARFQDLSRLNAYSRIRTVGNLLLNGLYSAVSGKKIFDMGSGLNVFRISDVPMASINQCGNGFTFNMNLLLEMISNKIDFCFSPISWRTTDQVSNARALNVGITSLIILARWALNLPGDKSDTQALTFKSHVVFPYKSELPLGTSDQNT